jgi:hypothetical protein
MKVLKAIDKFIDKHEETIFDVELLIIFYMLLHWFGLVLIDLVYLFINKGFGIVGQRC